MVKKRVFISFDFDNDLNAKVMLAGQAKHSDSPFDFTDASVKDHLTGDWKLKGARRLDSVDLVIVLCGQQTHAAEGVAQEVEIARQRGKPYFLLAAYSDVTCTKPRTAYATDKVYKWTWDNLKALVGGAR
jgi:hypothetical protein